jgi:hypothetical protein
MQTFDVTHLWSSQRSRKGPSCIAVSVFTSFETEGEGGKKAICSSFKTLLLLGIDPKLNLLIRLVETLK